MEHIILVTVSVCAAIVIVILGLRLKVIVKRQAFLKEKNRELELKINSYELENIRQKLNPHLFKNTLNSILSTAYQTYHSLDKLADVLDYILYESDRQLVTLEKEVDFALKLVEINRLKISPLFQLQVKNKIPPNAAKMLVAPLITVDLIENAFKHADLQSSDAFIAIIFEVKENSFILSVSNKISKSPVLKKERGGIGADNFEKKLKILYKDQYNLKRFTDNDIYIAQLTLNLFDHKDEVHIAG